MELYAHGGALDYGVIASDSDGIQVQVDFSSVAIHRRTTKFPELLRHARRESDLQGGPEPRVRVSSDGDATRLMERQERHAPTHARKVVPG